MKNKIVGLVILASLTGCGQNTSVITSDETAGSLATMPDSVQPYYNKFFRLIGSDKQLQGSIELVDLSSIPAIGVCNANVKKYSIQIDSTFWASATADQQATAVFHELTHCIFNDVGHAAPYSNSYMVELSDVGFENQTLELDAVGLAKELTVGGVSTDGIITNQQVIN